jgi:hypothetical protein
MSGGSDVDQTFVYGASFIVSEPRVSQYYNLIYGVLVEQFRWSEHHARKAGAVITEIKPMLFWYLCDCSGFFAICKLFPDIVVKNNLSKKIYPAYAYHILEAGSSQYS